MIPADSTEHVPPPAAFAADAERVVEEAMLAARQVIATLEHDAVSSAMAEELEQVATVLGVLQTKPSAWYCSLGYKSWSTHRGKGTVQTQYDRCKGGKCPHCCGSFWLPSVLRRAFRYVGTGTVYTAAYTDAEYTSRPIQRALKALPARFWIRSAVDGRRIVVASAPFDGAIGGNAVPTILDAFLRAPRIGRRFHGLPKEDELREHDPDEARGKLPAAVSPQSAAAVAEQAIGRELRWQEDVRPRGGSFAKRWSTSGLTSDEVDAATAALRPYDQQAEQEWSELLAFYREMPAHTRAINEFFANFPDLLSAAPAA